jgi:hypothetical protein
MAGPLAVPSTALSLSGAKAWPLTLNADRCLLSELSRKTPVAQTAA